MRSEAIDARLACVICHEPFVMVDGPMLSCRGCGRVASRLPDGRWDFRLGPDDCVTYTRRYSPATVSAALDAPLQTEQPSQPPRNRFADAIPVHLTSAQVSYLPTGRPGHVALDLGCGHGMQRGILEKLGYDCYAVDYEGSAADDLVDAHALPLRSASIDLVMSIAVLEHLADPIRAASEVFRVLMPGGAFVGTVAFLEPFHDNSFFHFTHLGLSWALRTVGFEVEVISPIPGWDVVRAQIEMELASGSRASRTLARAAAAPFVWALLGYGAAGRKLARARERYARPLLTARHAGAFFFVARRSMAVPAVTPHDLPASLPRAASG
jgi:SAM-dependent methyltransferase